MRPLERGIDKGETSGDKEGLWRGKALIEVRYLDIGEAFGERYRGVYSTLNPQLGCGKRKKNIEIWEGKKQKRKKRRKRERRKKKGKKKEKKKKRRKGKKEERRKGFYFDSMSPLLILFKQ